jgi:hypothetical protein
VSKDMGASQATGLSQAEPQEDLGPPGFDPSRALLEADATGDETLWVFRYASYFSSVTGQELGSCLTYANAAWNAWGEDPDCTPEEIASSDIACIISDSDGSPEGRDREAGLDGEAATARAEGIAK